LLHLDGKTGAIDDLASRTSRAPAGANDVLALNDTRVVGGRGRKDTGGEWRCWSSA
jgi:hypothetical protein